MDRRRRVQETTIAVAPNGGGRTKQDHPELARAACECLEAGASMIHVHIRNLDGTHLLDANAYRSAIAAIPRRGGG